MLDYLQPIWIAGQIRISDIIEETLQVETGKTM